MKLKAKKAAVKQTKVIVRWMYSHDFAKVLGRNQSGKGRARRSDVKEWAVMILEAAMRAEMGVRP